MNKNTLVKILFFAIALSSSFILSVLAIDLNPATKDDVKIYSSVKTEKGKAPRNTLILVTEQKLEKPRAKFKVNTNGLLAEFFSDHSLKYHKFVSLKWDFGDGYISREFDPMHRYHRPGNYLVKLSVVRINENRDHMAFGDYSKEVKVELEPFKPKTEEVEFSPEPQKTKE